MATELFFSVVMPVYNVEKYLKYAVESVLVQTYSHFELILVDDCSIDNSGNLCDEYARKDGRVRVMHLPKNVGAGRARDLGVAIAKGQYVHFMDSDDFLDISAYQAVYQSLCDNEAKVVVFGAAEEYYNHSGRLVYTKKITVPRKYFRCAEDLRKEIIYLESITMYGYLWNKFYNLQYLHHLGIGFSDMRLNEDILFNIEFFMDIDSMNLLDIAPYHYARRDNNSLTGKYVPEYFQWHRLRVEKLYLQHQYWGLCTDEVKNVLANIYFRYIISALQRDYDRRANMNHASRRMWLQKLFADELFCVLAPYAASGNFLFSVLIYLLRNKKVSLCIASAGLIFLVKSKLPILFARAKQNR